MPRSGSLRLALLTTVLCIPASAGYTHYFTWHQRPSAAALRDCVGEMRLLVEARRKKLAGPEGEGAPVIEAESLVFNGIGEDSHEPFVFPGTIERTPPIPKLDPGFNFCKTMGKPYDEVVTACLLVARDHFPVSVLAIGSDGSWVDGDWRDGTLLYSSVFRRLARNPIDGKVIPDDIGRESAIRGVHVPPRILLVVAMGVAVVFFLMREMLG